jgi:hypothetical protein
MVVRFGPRNHNTRMKDVKRDMFSPKIPVFRKLGYHLGKDKIMVS